MSVNLEQLSESLSSLTVLELAELSKKLEEKWGVSAASFANAGPAAGSVPQGTAQGSAHDHGLPPVQLGGRVLPGSAQCRAGAR